jgi:cytochrome c-type biogenesis protein CcmE
MFCIFAYYSPEVDYIMKKSSIFGLVIIAVAIAIIISIYGSSSSYGNFSEARSSNDELHVSGHLDKKKELYYDATKDANYFSFFMTDEKGQECKVVFTGTKPQDFERSEKIVLTGKMTGNEFHASKILMKCPSKYTPDKVEITEVKAKQANI